MSKPPISARLRSADDGRTMNIGHSEPCFEQQYTGKDVFRIDSDIYFRTIDALRKSVFRYVGPRREDAKTMHEVFGREVQQYAAAEQMGIDPADMLFKASRADVKRKGKFRRTIYSTNPELVVRFSGPKLAAAALYAASHRPTEFDTHRIAELGYESMEYLAERISVWNQFGSEPALPMPGAFPLETNDDMLPLTEQLNWRYEIPGPEDLRWKQE